jgi:hypothetical protein
MADGDRPPSSVSDPRSQRSLSPEQARAFLSIVMHIPWWWACAMVALAAASSVTVSKTASGAVVFHIAVGTQALGAIALLWLPGLLRLLSLTGGRGAAFGVEASVGGLKDAPEELIAGLARIRTEVSAEFVTPDSAPLADTVRAEVDRIAATSLSGTLTVTNEVLGDLARRYEHVRNTEPPSPSRAIAQNQILNEARVRARAAPETAANAAQPLLNSTLPGDRVIGLALLQQQPNPEALARILYLIQNSASAFEQYHALEAIEAMAPVLAPPQRAEARAIIEKEREDPRGFGLMQDPYLPGAISAALAALQGSSR